MANKTFQGRIVQKHDTKANWDKATNFIPLKGEIIVYDDLRKIKIGDGTTKVRDLIFISDLDTIDEKYLPLTGGTLNGSLTIKNLGNKLIVNTVSLLGKATLNSPCLQLSAPDDNLAVFISGVKSPLYNTDAANKEYVDTIVSNHASATIVTWTDDGT